MAEITMPRWSWIDRNFDLNFPVGKFPDLIERVRGTPARLEERIGPLTPRQLTRRVDDGWSILENAGHLLDLECLFRQRIGQIPAGEDELIAADMSNRKTHEARHNERDPEELLADFRAERMEIVAAMENSKEEDWNKSALHARTKLRMRIVDIAYFVAEHDDYHLARISELIKATA